MASFISSIVRRALTAAVALSFTAGAARAQRAAAGGPDWSALRDETVRVLSDYLRINTTNPPGNELAGALFLKAMLEKEGISATILDTAELGPGRANLYARLKGSGAKKAVAMVNHLDVVPASPQYWTVDPFSGVVKDGYVWGRGALDMRGEGIVQLMALIAIKRSGLPLTRDIVFIGNADEEIAGGGAQLFVKRHADLLGDVEFMFTEGGENPVRNGQLQYYGVGIAEKRAFWQKLTVHGVPSHGSRPTKQNPVPRLVAALDKIAKYETPLHVTPGVAKYFRDISRGYTGDQRAWLADVEHALADPRAREWILSDVAWNAALRNTISLTVLTGSNKTNVIPAEASAEIDVRLLPDQDPAAVLAELQRVVGDTAVHFSPVITPKARLENPIETDLFRAIERAARDRDPDALVTTPILSGATDRPFYRSLGIVSYGLDPFKVEVSESARGVHGNDERISIENLGFGVHFVYDVLRYLR
jgi:acetylornithine deacetylase/succinyl-diaminopimelate desuccinylase-like protein